MQAEGYIELVNQGLESFLDTKIQAAKNPKIKLLLKQQSRVIIGGKRLRPRLLFVGYQVFGGSQPESLVRVGIAIELLHQALLVHDDLIDQDLYRRGQPNVMGQRKQATNASGLLIGDLLLNWVNELVASDPGLSNEHKLAVIELLTHYLDLTIEGQVLDALNTYDLSIKPGELDKINELKTSSYSTLLPLAMVAQLLNISKSARLKLDSFANSLGRFLQLNNDIEDYLSPVARLSDYQGAKVTLPYLTLLNNATHVHKHILAKSFGHKLTTEERNNVRKVAQQVLTKEVLDQLTHSYYNKVIYDLDKLALKPNSRASFISIIDDLKPQAV